MLALNGLQQTSKGEGPAMTERKSGMTDRQMETILNEVFLVIMPKHRERMEEKENEHTADKH